MRSSHRTWAGVLAVTWIMAMLAGPASAADLSKVQHPFLLWTRQDIAAMKQRIATQPWAKKAAEDLVASKELHGDELRELFRYAVLDDKAAGEAAKTKLLRLLKAPDPLGGALEFDILRYDVLYDLLSPKERGDLEALMRRYIPYSIKPGGAFDSTLFNNTKNPPYSRYDGENGVYTRTNWLPNIIFPRKISANLMAVALRDEKLIRQLWETPGSIRYYLDDYLGDSGFYSEEFGKMAATPGALLLYCMGLRHLGLDSLGFGYQGRNGATMRGHIESLLLITYPRVDLGTSRPMYPILTLGDLRQYLPLQHALVQGYFPDGTGGNKFWQPAGAWGGTTRGKSDQWDNDKTEKMQARLWFEIAQRLWPDRGFDYFLAQMRSPDEDQYYPTLFFGLDPIDPRAVKPPPAPSGVYPQRGLVMLRHDQSPAYWESQTPAVAFRLPPAYAHSVNDAMTLSGYFALGRPIYLNPQTMGGYAFKFSRSIRSHCGVMVDGHVKITGEDWGQTGSVEPGFTDQFTTRQAFTPEVKFVAARTAKVYPDIDQTRGLFLTAQYLLDVSQLTGGKRHSFAWIVHTLGQPQPADAVWKPSTELQELIPELAEVRELDPQGADWSMSALQARDPQGADDPRISEAWFNRKVGVTVRMLGQDGLKAFYARTPPQEARKDGTPPPGKIAGMTLVATRWANDACFVALHEPFENASRIATFQRIAQTPHALAVAITGPPGTPAPGIPAPGTTGTTAPGGGINDRLMLRLGDHAEEPVTLAGQGESFTFADYAFVRIDGGTVTVRGNLTAMTLRVGAGPVKLLLNGQETPASVANGLLTYKK